MKNTILENATLQSSNVSRETPTADINSESKPKRSRSFALQCYDKRDDLITFLNNTPWVQHWALCTHDKDVWTKADEKQDPTHKEGTLKGIHTHVLIYTYEAKTVTAIRKNFARFSKEINPENPQNTLCQVMSDTVKMWRYLRHLDNPEKFQYSEDERICDAKTYWHKYEKTDGMNDVSRNNGFAMFTDILNGVPVKEMILRYGKEYIYHYNHFENVVIRHRQETALRNSEKSNVDEFVSALSSLLDFSSKYNSQQKALFSEMLKISSELLDLWEGVTYKIIKIDKNGEIL